MKKLQFSITINAPDEKVWDALWLNENYRNWCSVFQPGSFYESDLSEGSEILFLTPDRNGMYGIVEKNTRKVNMHFRHLGEVKNGEKQEENYGEEAIEQYDLVEKGDVTELTATLNAPEEYITYFTDVFPKALEKVKQIAENS